MIVERNDLPPNVDIIRAGGPDARTFYVREGATTRLLPVLARLGSHTASQLLGDER